MNEKPMNTMLRYKPQAGDFTDAAVLISEILRMYESQQAKATIIELKSGHKLSSEESVETLLRRLNDSANSN
jgi:hypothetical protein